MSSTRHPEKHKISRLLTSSQNHQIIGLLFISKSREISYAIWDLSRWHLLTSLAITFYHRLTSILSTTSMTDSNSELQTGTDKHTDSTRADEIERSTHKHIWPNSKHIPVNVTVYPLVRCLWASLVSKYSCLQKLNYFSCNKCHNILFHLFVSLIFYVSTDWKA